MFRRTQELNIETVLLFKTNSRVGPKGTRPNQKNAAETLTCLQRCVPPSAKPGKTHIDHSSEIIKAVKKESCFDLMTHPHRIASKPIESRRELSEEQKEGTVDTLVQNGLSEEWWTEAMECHCQLRNVTDIMADGTTACGQRFCTTI